MKDETMKRKNKSLNDKLNKRIIDPLKSPMQRYNDSDRRNRQDYIIEVYGSIKKYQQEQLAMIVIILFGLSTGVLGLVMGNVSEGDDPLLMGLLMLLSFLLLLAVTKRVNILAIL